ncbi:class I SAM-dependent methyltransferase [Candidatus Pelagibacter sp.]|nr:class I SAM-dependent methyltransferase [Candidatus Pelagibacter sp.]
MSNLNYFFGKKINIKDYKGTSLKDIKKHSIDLKKSIKDFKKLDKYKKKISKCILCNSSNLSKNFKILGTSYIQCLNCSHVTKDHYIPDQTMKTFFRDDKTVNSAHLNENSMRIKNIAYGKIKFFLKCIKKKNFKNCNWLDAGMGSGEILQLIKSKGGDCYGFDVGKPGIDVAVKQKLNNAYCSDVFDFYKIFKKKKLKKFDCISALGYLDVVSNPAKHLQILKKMLKVNGVIFLELPNYNSLTHTLIKSFPNQILRYFSLAQQSCYTEKSIRQFLKKNNFTSTHFWFFGLDFYQFLSTATLLNNKKINTLKKMVDADFNKIQFNIDNNRLSDNFIICAKKN